ncbi:MAG: branched-chain amino acid ABC transporter permease [Chloroflexota bacterium]|nr:branched-chain amino acid ABC transporter permease [Chloroflexota bacterium]
MSLDNIGQDEWVAQAEARRAARGPFGRALDRLAALNPFVVGGVLFALAALLPLLTSNDYILRIAGNVCLYGLLALGLNVVVGYAGLLDLGYMAFFGIGGYGYAMLASNQFGIHLPTPVALLLMIGVAALAGLLLGLPSLRLTGDYLAIVTLGFAQIFVLLTNTMDRVNLPWSSAPVNLTGGPNGITPIDPLHLFGWELSSVGGYFYILLAALALVLLVLRNINQSRVGRAWRALREDTLAAEAMGMPVRRLKLLAFAIGAAIAGLSGSIFAAWQTAVFPQNFDVALLITLYAMVVLGGLGSLPGAVAGALLLSVIPELLRGPDTARLLFYGGVIAMTLLLIKPRWRGVALLAAVLALGFAVKLVATALWRESLGAAPAPVSSGLGALAQGWLVFPENATLAGNLLFVVVIGMLMAISRLRQPSVRFALLIPTLYLLAFVWETRLAAEPSVTRLLFLGAILVLLMTYRPHGLFGKPRVEVV